MSAPLVEAARAALEGIIRTANCNHWLGMNESRRSYAMARDAQIALDRMQALAAAEAQPNSLQWADAPQRTQWGAGMMEALLPLGKDHTLWLYAEAAALHAVSQALHTALAAAEAQPVSEPVAWQQSSYDELDGWGGWHYINPGDLEPMKQWVARSQKTRRIRPLYASPAAQVPLTDEQIDKILDRERMKWEPSPPTYEFASAFARAIELAHGIGEPS